MSIELSKTLEQFLEGEGFNPASANDIWITRIGEFLEGSLPLKAGEALEDFAVFFPGPSAYEVFDGNEQKFHARQADGLMLTRDVCGARVSPIYCPYVRLDIPTSRHELQNVSTYSVSKTNGKPGKVRTIRNDHMVEIAMHRREDQFTYIEKEKRMRLYFNREQKPFIVSKL